MKKFYTLLPILLLVLCFSCNNEAIDIDDDEQENDVVLIPKKAALIRDFSGYTSTMNYDENGYPSLYTSTFGSDITIIYNDENLITQVSGFSYYYLNGILDYWQFANSGNIHTYTYDDEVIYITSSLANCSYICHEKLTFLTASHKRLISVESFNNIDFDGIPQYTRYFEYDDNLNVIREERFRFDEDTSAYILSFTAEQTYDDKNNFYKYADHDDNNIELIFIPYASENDASYLESMSRLAPNNVLTRTILSPTADREWAYNYEYNVDDYPISATRADNDGTGLAYYTFEYH